MANVLTRGELVDGGNPKLETFFIDRPGGSLIDVDTLEFAIFERESSPPTLVQTFPVSGRQSVDVANLFPTGDKLGTGHYAARYTVPAAEVFGERVIKWFFKVTPASTEACYAEEFSVVEGITVPLGGSYCTIQQLRDKGVPSTGPGAKTDAQLQALILEQSRLIDLYTGRFFEPRNLVQVLDGTGRRAMLLGDPIISISKIRLISEDFVTATDLNVDLNDVRIYNRHLSGLLNPDDRENPMIEFQEFDHRFESLPFAGAGHIHGIFHPHRWPEGTQNVEITGIFGYTDDDGTAVGKTPGPITTACCLMVIRNLISPLDPDYLDTVNAWRLTELKTRDQTIKWASPDKLGSRGVGAFTGDPMIDTILAAYTRPPQLGAA